jgi:SprT protein
VEHRIKVNITKSRASKYGDYRPPQMGKGHHITINHDLNQYAFLITFVHEVAHLTCEIRFRRSIDPHGREWKQEFQFLLSRFLHQHIFPEDVLKAVKSYISNPSASSCSDLDLQRTLKKYDLKKEETLIHVEDLPHRSIFELQQSRKKLVLIKGEKRRTRFHCVEVGTAREYLVNPLAEAKPVKTSEN